MAIPYTIFSPENPLFRTYLFYVCILGIKMLLMSPFTAMKRMKNKAFANPEDGATLKVRPKTDDNVERVRRAHMNDVENIFVFFTVSLAYIATNPALAWATLLFRVFTAARIMHTLVYAVVVVPQPARAIAWLVGWVITIYMAVQTAIYFK